jgi:hypothetical protein
MGKTKCMQKFTGETLWRITTRMIEMEIILKTGS